MSSRQTAGKGKGNPKHLLLMFDRPLEPTFRHKGKNKSQFNLPASYLTDRYKTVGVELADRYAQEAGETINVTELPPPNLSGITKLKRDENFSLFFPKHRECATNLINLFMACKSVDELQSRAAYCRDRVNPYLFNYSLSVAILHRNDTKSLDLPPLMEVFPDKYIDSQVFSKIREELDIVPEGSRAPIELPVDYTASNLEDEHKVAYFREDLGLNLHHWHWHLVYPFNGPREIVAKDRRGELFFFFHHQMQARYNWERLCNDLARVVPYENWREPIPEAYFPKLDSLVANRSYPARPANMVLKDVNREQDQWQFRVSSMELYRNRIFEAIHSGKYLDENNNLQTLTEFGGIDVIGNMLEASILTPNSTYYGDLHNWGHATMSVIHDPDLRHLESFSTIGDPATSARDPIFYRFHEYVNDMFLAFKNTLPRYTTQQLNYEGVRVTAIQIQSEGGTPNVINTFWQQSDVDLTRGMDFQPRGSIFVRFTHLNHQPFSYVIRVNNSGPQRQGTCRIFMAPKFNERGIPLLFVDQKDLLVEMDRFVVNLRPGDNIITQASTKSSVTIPFERTFRNLESGRPSNTDAVALDSFNFCGCGWPQHLLICKGKPDGYPMELFVMISNIADDRVNQAAGGACDDAFVYCGLRNKLYPDKRSMGYPFDRMPRAGVDTLSQFMTPNMRLQDVSVNFLDRVIRPKGRTPSRRQ